MSVAISQTASRPFDLLPLRLAQLIGSLRQKDARAQGHTFRYQHLLISMSSPG